MRSVFFQLSIRATFVVLALWMLSTGVLGDYGQDAARAPRDGHPDIEARGGVSTSPSRHGADPGGPAIILAQGFSSGAEAQSELARIVSINKRVARAGELITLEIAGVPTRAYDYDILVIIGGYTVQPEPGSGPGLLIARVPLQLTEAAESLDVFVRFTPRGVEALAAASARMPEPIILRYEGSFAIFESTWWQQIGAFLDSLEWYERAGLLFYAAAVIGAFGLVPLYVRRRARRHEKSALTVSAGSTTPVATPAPDSEEAARAFTLEPPGVPDALVTVMAQGDGVVFAGAGMSAQAGLPVWRDMLALVIEGLLGKEEIQGDFADRLIRLLRNGDVEDAADGLVTARGFEISSALSLIRETIDGSAAKPSDAHRVMAQLPLAALLTTNFDDLLEQAFKDREPVVVAPSRANAGLDALSQGKFFLLKLSGVLDRPERVILSPKQHADMVRESPAFNDLLDRIILSRTILFVGVSLDGIEEFFRGTSTSPHRTGEHFALVAAEDDGWEIKASTLERLFGVRVLPFAYGDRAAAVTEFLGELHTRVTEHRKQFEVAAPSRSAGRRSHLRRVELTNVGPFAALSFDLEKTWNLFLGDNGVGKSTILKAITVALVGKAAQPWAGRIIKSGTETATIILHTDTKQSYRTTVTQESDGSIEVDSGSLTALAGERWLALGFPALRTVTWDRSQSEPSLGIGRPMAGDLLPLITNEPDPRLDGLKQRIVKLKGGNGAQGKRAGVNYDGLMQDLIRLFGDILEDMPIEIKGVDPNTDEVTVLTADGEVPFESLSQGTTSLIAWAGVLLQRLYETAGPDDKKPHERQALVMIDELDAHMHPVWQNDIVRRLKKSFPKVQFLAATHSPLVVRGMDMDCIKRFKRNAEGRVAIVDVPDDMTMGRADQVLASGLFDTAGYDPITEDTIKEYRSLLAKEELSDGEKRDLRMLENRIRHRIPVPETTPRDRHAREVFTKLLEVQMLRLQEEGSQDDEIVKARQNAQADLMVQANELLDELERTAEVRK